LIIFIAFVARKEALILETLIKFCSDFQINELIKERLFGKKKYSNVRKELLREI
jgi:hypothetical protein